MKWNPFKKGAPSTQPVEDDDDCEFCRSPWWFVTPCKVIVTQCVARQIDLIDVADALQRHLRCDWGVVETGQWKANDSALSKSGRLLSMYQDRCGHKFWIITDLGRNLTEVFTDPF